MRGVHLCRESSWWCRACAHPPGFSTKSCVILSPIITAPAESGAELEGEVAATEDVPGEAVGEPHPPQAAAGLLPGGLCPPIRSLGNPIGLPPQKLSPKSQPERPPLLRNNYLWFETGEQMVFLY